MCDSLPDVLAGYKAHAFAFLAGTSLSLGAAVFAVAEESFSSSINLSEPVLFAGCQEVFEGPVCVRAAGRPLTFWIGASRPFEVIVEVDGEQVAPELVEAAGGFRFSLEKLDHARQIIVRNLSGTSVLELPLVSLEQNEDLDEADKLRKDNRTIDRARAHAKNALQLDNRVLRARASSLIARMDMRLEDGARAVSSFSESLHAHDSLGCTSAQYLDLMALTHMSIYRRRDFERAKAALERAVTLSIEDTERRAELPYYQALFAKETGRLGAAVEFLSAAEAGALKLGLARVHDVRMVQLEILLLLGRRREASDLLERLTSSKLDRFDPCHQAEILNNLAHHSLVIAGYRDQTMSPDVSALRLANESIKIFKENCSDPVFESYALATLAMAQYFHGDYVSAQATLARAEELRPVVEDRARVDRLELRAKLADRRGAHEESLKAYAELAALAESSAQPFVRWRGLVGEAETLEAMNRDREALARYDAGDELFRELLALVPLGDGRDDFAQRNERAAARHVGLLVRLKEVDRAIEVARLSRVRALGLLDVAHRVDRMSQHEEKSWIAALNEYRRARNGLDEILDEEAKIRDARLKLPADELDKFLAQHKNIAERGVAARRALKRAFDEAMRSVGNSKAESPGKRDQTQLADGDLLLVYHPIPEGWVAFARTNKKTRMEILPTVGDATSLLSPFSVELDRAKRVVVMPFGPLEDLNFHAVLAGDKPLGMRVKLSYGIDVESAAKAKSSLTARAGGLAVIVAVDPTDTLKTIEREARTVSDILTAQGHEVVLVFGEKATRAELSRWLADPRVTHFHFAGHAVSGGRDGLESRLLLADGSLTGTDLLALGRAPKDVVISACEAGKASASGGALGLGLAQAFILAGAKRVVASSTPAEDARTFAMMKAAYESGSALDAGAVVKAAFEAGQGSAGWDSFRVVEAW